MNTIIGWLKFNENKDEECKECNETPCNCDKDENVENENEGISFEEFEAEYNALSIEEKRAIPEGFKKFLKKKGEGKKDKKDGKKEDKEGGKPEFWKNKK